MMDHKVERRGAAQAFAASVRDSAVVGASLRLGEVAPVHGWDRVDESSSDTKEGAGGRGP